MLPLSPLLLVASSLIPDLIKIIAGDRAGTVAKEVEQAVRSVTSAQDAPEAREKLAADPQVAAALQVKLAQIAVDATRQQLEEEDRKRQDALRQWQLQLEADDRLRKDELTKLRESLKADNENTANARDMLAKLMQTGSPLQWVPAWVSTIVILFFAVAVFALIAGWGDASGQYKELLNICVGALVAGFSTVISYWLGSSQGSREKDLATRAQAIQATEQQARPQPTSQAVAVAESPSGTTVAASTSVAAPGTPAASPATPVSKIDKFERCITHVLAAEGGFSNNPDDPGGATNFGITLATLATWRKRNRKEGDVNEQEVRNLTLTEAKDIYRSDYWNALRCDALPAGVDLVVFDFGVNAGPGRSAKTLQDIVGVLQDGSIGPQTLHNVPLVDGKRIITEFGEKRRQFYRDLPQFPIFGKGWLARVSRIEEAAVSM